MLKRIALWLLFLPLQAFIASLLSLCELLRCFSLPLRRSPSVEGRKNGGDPLPPEVCSIVMLNWNGRRLLEQSLPALEKAVRFTRKDHEIILVDNGSRDDSVRWVRKNHPQVRVITLEENLGFGEGNNRGVEMAHHEIVVLLNNDMVVSEDFLSPLLQGFRDPQVFAVSSQIFLPEGKRREETGNTQARLEKGYLHLSHQPVLPRHYSRRLLPVLWAGGGCSAFHRRRFLRLGGFSPLFSPCYCEDTDLSYRAWRRGFKVLLAADSKALHQHRASTTARFDESQLQELMEERKLWYLWKNYQLRTLLSHLILFPLHITNHSSITGYLRSLRKLPSLLRLRFQEGVRAQPDNLLFNWIRRPLLYLNHSANGRSRRQTPGSPLRILIVSAYLPHPRSHGGAGRIFQLLRQVSKKNEVTLVTFVETDRESEELKNVLAHCRRIEAVHRGGFIPVSYYPYEPFEEFNCPDLREKLEQVLAEEDFDLVHFEWTQMVQYADLVPNQRKLVTEVEVNYAAHRSLLPLEPNLLRKLRKLYNTLQTLYREIELCRKVDAVVCVTDTDREYLRGYLPSDKLHVINTGVDTSYFTCGDPAKIDPNAIIYVGAFRHEPNVDAMLYFCAEVFPLILRERPQAHLHIVGAAPPGAILRLGAHPNITVTGFVEDLRDYYRKAQVVVVPLRTGVGIRGKILEGWAAGTAIVATRLACWGIRAGHGENILMAENTEEFALWTLALLRNPDFAARLGRAGRETAVQFYDWRLMGEQMLSLYEGLASGQ